MKNASHKDKLSVLTRQDLKNLNGGVLPFVIVSFAKGFAWGAGVAGTAITAVKATDKLVNEITS